MVVAALACVCFFHWVRYQRRLLIHRERMAAVEKGVTLPPLEQEVRRNTWNVQRIILLAGLTWISIGIGAFVTLSSLIAFPSKVTEEIPHGMQWIGLAPFCIGLSHVIVYLVGKGKEN